MTRMHRRGAAAFVAIALAMATAFFSQVASAYPPGTAATITLSSNSVPQGGSVGVDGQHFAPNSTVTLTLHSAPVALGTVQSDSAGSFSTSVTIPSDTPTGAHQVVATDGTDTASANLTVTASNGGGNGGGLGNTGVAVASIGGIGLLLVIGGGLALLAGRRRNTTTV